MKFHEPLHLKNRTKQGYSDPPPPPHARHTHIHKIFSLTVIQEHKTWKARTSHGSFSRGRVGFFFKPFKRVFLRQNEVTLTKLKKKYKYLIVYNFYYYYCLLKIPAVQQAGEIYHVCTQLKQSCASRS